MDEIKKTVAVFAIIMLVIALAAPAVAQTYGGRMAQPQAGGYQRGGQQAMPQQGQQGGMPQSNKDLMATMEDRSDISMFTAAVKALGYDRMLSQQSQNPYIVFAPTDRALQRDMGVTDVNTLMSDTNAVKSLVENCIVSNVSEPPEGSNTITMTTLGGMQLTATKSNTGITVNGVKVIDAVMATNGMLAVTDGVVGMQGGMPAVSPSVMPSAVPTRMPGGMRGYR
jgi:uncharacterized surface protein with fasciclin (FAS1) repeats